MPEASVYSIGQVADFCGVSRITAIKWVKEGRIQTFELPSGHLRVTKESLMAFMNDYHMPIPQDLMLHGKKVLVLSPDLDLSGFLKQCMAVYNNIDFQWNITTDFMEASFILGIEKPDIFVIDERIKQLTSEALTTFMNDHTLINRPQLIRVTGHDPHDNEQVMCKPWSEEVLHAQLKGLSFD